MRGTQVLVLTKAPIAGRTKTRLSPPCSLEQAAAIAAAAVQDTLDAVRGAAVTRRVVALDGPPAGLDLDGCVVIDQADGDLGRRLAAAFTDAMRSVPLPTLLIGMDTPQVTADLLDRCTALLLSGGPDTAVLGGASDGGWWALGLHSATPAVVLVDVPTSRTDTGERTRRALEEFGLRVFDLPELTDIDYFGEAVTVAQQCPFHSRTRRVVAGVAAALGGT